MSIVVEGVTRMYGSQKALDNVSFTIGTGEIVGFLGPNGAGKSTMMRIITGYIPPTSGTVLIDEVDVASNNVAIRKKIGYLPENNPLYPDMYVKEYLGFIADIHALKKPGGRIAEIVSLTGLSGEQHKKIGALSKGYRQRVGLAQALIHDPEILILDEPTSGLDPNQIVEIRNLISEAGKHKTVMLSTHIMQEVEALCHRIIIIDRGVVKADSLKKEIFSHARENTVTVMVEFASRVSGEMLGAIPGATRTKNVDGNQWLIESQAFDDIRPSIFKFAVDNGLTVLSMQQQEQSLEEVFRKLTT